MWFCHKQSAVMLMVCQIVTWTVNGKSNLFSTHKIIYTYGYFDNKIISHLI